MSRPPEIRLYMIGATLWLLATASVFTLDSPLARYDVSHVPGDLRRLVQLSEVFGHGTGVGLILLAIWVLDRDRRLFIPRVVLLTFLPGIFTRAGKLLVSRSRPMVSDLDSAASASFLDVPGSPASWDLQSFPSGHATTAVGFALALSYLYPRGRYLFAVFALLAVSQRVLFDAHFLSDTLVGAGIACFVAALLRDRLLWDARS
ncbi:MAG TPA: phosphatase PAP2 family protein [Pirellulaceae bacterium]|nr:phosphatase PAP2 family protein [Pirellulaceae bacterium]